MSSSTRGPAPVPTPSPHFQRSASSYNRTPRSKTPGPSYNGQRQPEPIRRPTTPMPCYDGGPWQQTMNTYAWILHQQYEEMRAQDAQRYATTVETHIFESEWAFNNEANPRFWDETAHSIRTQATIWMIREEAKRVAALREAERLRQVEEGVRKIHAKMLYEREKEREKERERRQRKYEEWCRAAADIRAKENRQKAVGDRNISAAWNQYESRWATILSSTESITFRSIPWPTLNQPSSPELIKMDAISSFLLSQAHSQSQSPKERIKEALRRWHPDRFSRLLSRVPENEKAKVEEGAGIVTRCLNELLSKQSNSSRTVSIFSCTWKPGLILIAYLELSFIIAYVEGSP